jgi:hypothetical protein
VASLTQIVDEGVSSVQPKEAPFGRHNARVQRALEGSSAASRDASTWWRTERGLITVINPLTGRELWAAVTAPLGWGDWAVQRLRDGKVEGVDLRARVARRRARDIAIVGAVLAVAGYAIGLPARAEALWK